MTCCKHSQNGARFFLHRHILLPSAFWDFPWRGGEMPGAGACLGHVLLPSALGLGSPAYYVVPFCNLAGCLS